jgi:hypothetical protein
VKRKVSWSIFWALIVVFIIVVMIILTPATALAPAFGRSSFIWTFFTSGAIFFLLGAALIFFTLKEHVRGMPKNFLILTGACAVGLPLFAALHNLVYALLISWFGENFWGAGGDEPFFFILATIVCPIGFLVGAVGTIVLAIRNKRAGYSG